MTVFSFHPVKHITTGEGGMVTTDDPDLARKLRAFRSHGIESDARSRQALGQWYYEMTSLGYNYRLSDIHCALGLSQLRRIDANLARRRTIAGLYSEAFRGLPGITLPGIRENANPAWHLYPLRFDLADRKVGKPDLFRALRSAQLGVNVHYVPVHLHPYYRSRFGYRKGSFPLAEKAYEQLISLPMFHAMTDEDVQDVISIVTGVVIELAGRVCTTSS
jgi:perosamine synthetase